MPIHITQQDAAYTARVTPPNGNRIWSSSEPLSAEELVSELRNLGCHTTDIGDAFYEAHPLWLTRPGLEPAE